MVETQELGVARLNLEQIRAFLTVVRMGGVKKASQALFLSQPAITARIKNLEEALSKELFDRTAAGLRLTKAGEIFLTYAERFEHLEHLIDKHVIDESGIEGHLRLGASETITQCWLPDLVSRLHQRFPSLQVEIHVDISVNLRSSLLDRDIDLAFLLGPVSEFSVDNIALPGFDLGWYAAAGRAPSNRDASAFVSQPVITYLRQTRPYRELKGLLLEKVGPGVTLFPSSSLSACFRLVEAGIGVAALPKALATPFIERGSIEEFDPGWVPRPLEFTASYLGDPRSHMVEIAAQMALDVARKHAGIEIPDMLSQK